MLFSGDLGNGLSPLLPPPQPAPEADAVFVDTTYGPITRKASVKEQRRRFAAPWREAVGQGGVTWIPCFALHRTQQILYELHVAQREKLLPEHCRSIAPHRRPRRSRRLYRKHQGGWFSPDIAGDPDAFSPHDVHTPCPRKSAAATFIFSARAICWSLRGCGICWARCCLNRPPLLLVAYQPPGSAGNCSCTGRKKLDIDGQAIPVRAKVQAFSCFSGHADAAEIDAWLGNVSKEATVILIHGDKEQLDARAEQLRAPRPPPGIVAKPGEAIQPGMRPALLIFRRCVTVSAILPMVKSTSSAVLNRPSPNRTLLRTVSSSRPRLRSTWLGSGLADVQALPELRATSRMFISSDSPST